MHLWEAGLDYNHGTGHGVGAYLNVHEGPQSISPTRDIFGAPLEPGNILSNEPGYYEAGAYGIRIENLILVREEAKHSKNGTSWLGFDTITLCPIETRLIEPKLLTQPERTWLNQYHSTVYKTLSPRLSPAEKSWLRKATAAV
ncbi:MAG: M24 family metallopeptidase C-terminal domain-containing protein [Candidatus Eisenbacteria bacterium]|nr:M24 family metallopeptidase C-terminal domain-containing protein [Candidatus Eisenbacteria bacterium]